MSKIITCPGTAKRDDLLSISFVLCKDANVKLIERREPTSFEIDDPNIWVLNVGKVYNPDVKAFNCLNESTFSLLLKEYDLYDTANKALSWLKTTVSIGSHGFEAICKAHNIEDEKRYLFQSPTEDPFIDELSQKSTINPEDWLFLILKKIGLSILYKIDEYTRLTQLIEKKCVAKRIKGVPVIKFLEGESSKTLSSVIYNYKIRKFGHIRGGLSIIRDNRNENCIRLYRFNNDKRIDFKRLNGNYPIRFLHEKEFLSVIDLPEDESISTFVNNIINVVIV